MDWLGLPSTASISGDGAVQGRPAELRYARHPHKLIWKYKESSSTEHEVLAERIIGLVSVHQHLNDDYSLLYVESDDSKPVDELVQYTYFRSLILTKPPLDLIQDFTPSGRSCWAIRHEQEFAGKIKSQIDAGEAPVNVILSTKSGHGDAEVVYRNLLKPFLDHLGCSKHAVFKTMSAKSITNLSRNTFLPAAKKGTLKMIVLLSGDGGVVDLVNGLLPASATYCRDGEAGMLPDGFVKPNFGLLPLGTGNALAHSSGITHDRTMGMAALVRGYPQDLPMFTVRFSPPARAIVPASDDKPSPSAFVDDERVTEVHGAVVFSWALHAALVADSDTPAYREHGAARFQMAAKENLFPPNGGGPHPYRGKVSFKRSNSDEWEQVPRETHSYLLATLCSKLEEKFTISPASKPLDGRLRLVHFGTSTNAFTPMTGEDIVGLMQKAYDEGKHTKENAVGYEEIECLQLKMEEDEDMHVDEAHGGSGRWRRVCIDGTIYLCDAGATIEVLGPRYTRSVAQMVRSPD